MKATTLYMLGTIVFGYGAIIASIITAWCIHWIAGAVLLVIWMLILAWASVQCLNAEEKKP